MAGVIFKNKSGATASINASLDKTSDSTTGTVNNPVEFLAYQGKDTESASTDVDNLCRTISVTVKGAGNDNKGNVISETYINDITISQEADGKLKLQADAPNKKGIVDKTFAIDLKKAKGMYYDENKELDKDQKKAC